MINIVLYVGVYYLTKYIYQNGPSIIYNRISIYDICKWAMTKSYNAIKNTNNTS